MSASAITTIIGIIFEAIEAGIKAGKSFREAAADSLAEASEKIRDGRINIDATVERAHEDQKIIDALYSHKK